MNEHLTNFLWVSIVERFKHQFKEQLLVDKLTLLIVPVVGQR